MNSLNFLSFGKIKKLRKNSVIKNVRYITQEIRGELVTIELNPPRNLKINNKETRRR